jgi:hypothetical protein
MLWVAKVSERNLTHPALHQVRLTVVQRLCRVGASDITELHASLAAQLFSSVPLKVAPHSLRSFCCAIARSRLPTCRRGDQQHINRLAPPLHSSCYVEAKLNVTFLLLPVFALAFHVPQGRPAALCAP